MTLLEEFILKKINLYEYLLIFYVIFMLLIVNIIYILILLYNYINLVYIFQTLQLIYLVIKNYYDCILADIPFTDPTIHEIDMILS